MKKTELLDKSGKEICVGDIVEWDDSEGKRTARVIYENGEVGFHCFKNSKPNWAIGHKFMIGTFIYANTSEHLTIIESVSNSNPVEQESLIGIPWLTPKFFIFTNQTHYSEKKDRREVAQRDHHQFFYGELENHPSITNHKSTLVLVSEMSGFLSYPKLNSIVSLKKQRK